MLIIALLILAAASVAYVIMRQRGFVWPARITLGAITIVAWLLSVGAYALATDSLTGPEDEISFFAKVMVASFLAFPLILWMAARSFERGRSS